jgi:hypothetical protein
MDGDPRVDVRLHAVGEGAVIRDRQGQPERREPDRAVDVGDRRHRRVDAGEPAVHPQAESELHHRERQQTGREPGLERQRVRRDAPEEGGPGVVRGVLGAEDVEAGGDREGKPG